jgi:hypothetical protein
MNTTSEIWIRLAAPADGGEQEVQRRVKQLTKAARQMSLRLIEVRQVQVMKGNDDES